MRYPNLEAELARRGLNYKDVAEAVGKSTRTITNKLNGTTSFTIAECLAIKDNLMPDINMDIGTLFESE